MKVSENMENIKNFLYSNVKDIIDESDEILHVKYQLLYTIGK